MNIIRLPQNKFNKQMEISGIDDSNVEHLPNDFFICLNSTGWIHGVPYFKQAHNNVINLYFDDVEVSGPKEIQWYNNSTKIIDAIAMNESQAKELANFINKIPKNSNIYVYCAKGKSRSGAVEDFIQGLTNKEHQLNDGSNKHVYKLLKENYNEL